MEPAQPPLPTPWNLPFHPDAGIQTSSLMSESVVGATVAATRQNAGTSGIAWAAWLPAAGGVNDPAGTSWAMVIVVLGSLSAAASASQPTAGVWPNATAGKASRARNVAICFMNPLF